MRVKTLAPLLCALALLAATAPSHAAGSTGRKLYKWVDEQGVTHFGDHIPPEYANQEQHIVNSQGVETDHIDAQKTADQLAAEEQKRQDAVTRANRDKNLLNTYVSLQEIEEIGWKVQKLKDILNEVERDWTSQVINKIKVYIPGANKRDNKRGFTIVGSPAVWYWLDVKDEIP